MNDVLHASFLARVDIRHPGQRELLERHLLSPALSDRELEKFIRLFPNANRFLSFNLLTDSPGRELGDLAAVDAATLEQVGVWQTQPRFARLESRLKLLETRLREQVAGATRGGCLPQR